MKLNKEEKKTLKEFTEGNYSSVASDQDLKILRESAKLTLRKNKRINIRLSEQDYSMIKDVAQDEGLPYQTLIASIIHKYINTKLLEKRR